MIPVVMIDDARLRAAAVPRVMIMNRMGSSISKLMTEAIACRKARSYAAVEAPKGELGVYLVLMGANKPYRLKVRAPGFAHLGVRRGNGPGHMLADVVAVIRHSKTSCLAKIDR